MAIQRSLPRKERRRWPASLTALAARRRLIRGKISPFRRRTRSQDGSRPISSWVVSLHNRPQGSRGEGCSGSKCLPGLQSTFDPMGPQRSWTNPGATCKTSQGHPADDRQAGKPELQPDARGAREGCIRARSSPRGEPRPRRGVGCECP